MLVSRCECGGAIIRPPGTRGRKPTRCDACRSTRRRAPAPAPEPEPDPGPGPVEQALHAELAAMPDRVQASTEAAAARALARQVDQGLSMTAATRELTRVVALLRTMAPAPPPVPAVPSEGEVPRGVADLAARAAERRRSAAG